VSSVVQSYLMWSYVVLCGEFFERRTAVRLYLLPSISVVNS